VGGCLLSVYRNCLLTALIGVITLGCQTTRLSYKPVNFFENYSATLNSKGGPYHVKLNSGYEAKCVKSTKSVSKKGTTNKSVPRKILIHSNGESVLYEEHAGYGHKNAFIFDGKIGDDGRISNITIRDIDRIYRIFLKSPGNKLSKKVILNKSEFKEFLAKSSRSGDYSGRHFEIGSPFYSSEMLGNLQSQYGEYLHDIQGNFQFKGTINLNGSTNFIFYGTFTMLGNMKGKNITINSSGFFLIDKNSGIIKTEKRSMAIYISGNLVLTEEITEICDITSLSAPQKSITSDIIQSSPEPLKNRLKKLKNLFDEGLIQENEYDRKRKAILEEL
jgi:hypothetical protein